MRAASVNARFGIAACIALAACGRLDFGPRGTVLDVGDADTKLVDTATAGIVNVGNNVQATNASTSQPLVLTVAPTGQDHLLVLGVSWCCGTAALPPISDDKGNVWQSAGTQVTDGMNGDDYVAIVYSLGAIPGVTQITIDFSNFNAEIFSEWANVDLSAPVDGYAAAVAANATTGDSGPLTPDFAGDLIMAVGDDDVDGNPAVAGPGFALVTPGIGMVVGQAISMEYKIDADTAALDGTMTWQAQFYLPVAMAAFKAR